MLHISLKEVLILHHKKWFLRRFAKVVQDHAKIKSIKFKSFSEAHKQSLSIPIDVNKINKILGTSLEE